MSKSVNKKKTDIPVVTLSGSPKPTTSTQQDIELEKKAKAALLLEARRGKERSESMGTQGCLETLAFHSVVSDPACIALAGATLGPQQCARIFAWLASHDLLTVAEFQHGVQLFLENIDPLKYLQLDAIALNDTVLQKLSEKCGQVEYAYIACAFRSFDSGMRHLFKSLASAKRLEILELKIDEENVLTHLNAPCLEHLTLQLYVRNENWADLNDVMRRHRRLKKLSITTRGRTVPKEDLLFATLADKLCASLIELEVNNFTANQESLRAVLLGCIRLKKLRLSGSMQLDTRTMLIAKSTALWEQFHICFKVNAPTETYRALQYLPPTVTDLGLMFGPSVRSTDVRDVILQAVLNCAATGKLTKLKFHVEFFNDTLIQRFLPQVGNTLIHLDIGLCDSLTDVGFSVIADSCANLTHLLVHSDSNKYNRQATAMPLLRLLEVPERALQLKVVYLNFFKNLSPDFLSIVVLECKNLEELSLASVHAVNDELLVLLSANCRVLRCIDVSGCWGVTDVGVMTMALNLPLVSLNIAMCFRLTNSVIHCLTEHCPHLQRLLYNGIPNITRQAVDRLKKACNGRLQHYLFQWYS